VGTFGSKALHGVKRLALENPHAYRLLSWFGLGWVVGHTWEEVFRNIEWEGLQGKEKDRQGNGTETVGSKRNVKRASAAAAAFIITLWSIRMSLCSWQ
jgi:hypothetical protein